MIPRDMHAAATFEREQRERLSPERVRRAELSAGEAQADYQAWCRIEEWLSDAHNPGTNVVGFPGAPWSIELPRDVLLSWDPARAAAADRGEPIAEPTQFEIMHIAASRALVKLEQACERKPADQDLAERRGRIATIVAGLRRTRALLESPAADSRTGATDPATSTGAGAAKTETAR